MPYIIAAVIAGYIIVYTWMVTAKRSDERAEAMKDEEAD